MGMSMTLLIVDDQSQVIKGIVTGVDWRAEGFGEVYTAYNTAEARRVLAEHTVDVLLCDIEMPVESGLSLVKWMRGKGMQTRCIFLTSHMSFDYAQQALRLGSTDYLVLPAPYPEIRKAVRKATSELELSRKRDKQEQFNQLIHSREDAFAEGLLNSYITSGEAHGLADAQRLGYLPDNSTPCYLILIHVLRQEGRQKIWDSKSLRYAISNIIAEIFAEYGQTCYTVGSDSTRLCYLIFGKEYQMDFEGIIRQLDTMIQLGTLHLNCVLACYTDAEIRLTELPKLYAELWQRSNGNVALSSKVFYTTDAAPFAQHLETLSQAMYSRMHKALVSGHVEAVRQHNLEYLRGLIENGQMNVKTLEQLSKGMIQLFNLVFSDLNLSLHQVYPDEESFSIYRSCGKSVEHLQALVEYTLNRLESLIQIETEEDYSIDRIIAYIHEHLEEDIRCNELAAHFHLNPDYLTRVFKKEAGQTLKEFITSERIAVAQGLLRTTSIPVGMVAAKAGFGSLSHFSKVYQKALGRTPTEERNIIRHDKRSLRTT